MLFALYSIYLVIITINMLAQMVRMLAFDAHVLGSIPGVCILLFSQQMQVNTVLHTLKRTPYTLKHQPFDVLLARSNVSTMKDHHVPQSSVHKGLGKVNKARSLLGQEIPSYTPLC